MKTRINLIKHFGAYSINLKKEVDLPIPPMYGMSYFDTTNGEEIECNFSTGPGRRCNIYVYGKELCVDVDERIHEDTDFKYITEWKESCMKAGFTLMNDESTTIERILTAGK